MILRGATCITLDSARRVVQGDLRVAPNGTIDSLGGRGSTPAAGEEMIDRSGRIILPGFVQTHTHLCQTLFRGMAERLPLERWLVDRIWPLESAHDALSVRASARLGVLELLAGGTTAILDMGTTRHIEAILEVCDTTGIRAVTGTAIMDEGGGLPAGMRRDALEVIEETASLLRRRRAEGARTSLCLAPRFIPTVSDAGWRALSEMAEREDLLIHTHACETRGEIRMTMEKTGKTPLAHLEAIGVPMDRVRAAHGVWLSDEDRGAMRRSRCGIVHCPGSNAKLGSGTADILRILADGTRVGIGCDGAACNNRLDIWEEMRRAAAGIALLHAPEKVDAAEILRMATVVGADLLGMGGRIGSIEEGKDADLVVLDPAASAAMWAEGDDPHARVLFGAGPEHVEEVWIAGRRVAERGRVRNLPAETVYDEARTAARRLRGRLEAR